MKDSLAVRVADSIRLDFIDSGLIQPGEQLPTVRELAARYGASMNTVSNALGRLAALELVRKQQGQGCFRTDISAPRLNGLPETVGLVTCSPSEFELGSRLYDGVELACRRRGIHVVLASTESDVAREEAAVNRAIAAGCRAVVVYPVVRRLSEIASDHLNTLHRDTPIVLVDTTLAGFHRTKVVFDNRRAGRDMTRFLLGRGYSSIAFMRGVGREGEVPFPANRDRFAGYLDALAEEGRAPRPCDIWNIPHDETSIGEALQRRLETVVTPWLAANEGPGAVIAIDDRSAVAAIHFAEDLGLRIPGEFAVAGFDNLREGQSVRYDFPTTRADFARAGELAVEHALELLEGSETGEVTYMLPVPLVLPDGRFRADAAAATAAVPADAGRGPT